MKKKKQPVAVRIETVRQGMPYPFSPAFNRDDAQEFMATLLGIEADDETDGTDGIDLTDEPNGTAGPETETETNEVFAFRRGRFAGIIKQRPKGAAPDSGE